jgi:cell division protein FtsL
MAQSKREQINVVGKEVTITRAEKNTVPELLLQQHRIALIRNLANRISCHALFLLNVGCLILVNRLTLLHLIASISIALLVAYLWYLERQLARMQLKALEITLAERSGEEWEDIFIQSRYHTTKHTGLIMSLRFEPIIWAMFITLLGLLRFFFEGKLGI